MTVLPTVVRNKALAAGAGWWIDELDDTVAGIEKSWSIVVGRTYEDATEALVSAARGRYAGRAQAAGAPFG